MRAQQLCLLFAAISPTVFTSPLPSLFGDIVASLEGAVNTVTTTLTTSDRSTAALAAAVKKLGLTLQTNAGQHGPKLGCNDLNIGQTSGIFGKAKHGISWPFQKRSYVDWKTYKSNGVNLGIWFEQEQNYDVEWWAENVGEYPDE